MISLLNIIYDHEFYSVTCLNRKQYCEYIALLLMKVYLFSVTKVASAILSGRMQAEEWGKR